MLQWSYSLLIESVSSAGIFCLNLYLLIKIEATPKDIKSSGRMIGAMKQIFDQGASKGFAST